jgi:hypothetical protein
MKIVFWVQEAPKRYGTLLHRLRRRLYPFLINLVHIIFLVGRLLRCIWPGDKVREEGGAGV